MSDNEWIFHISALTPFPADPHLGYLTLNYQCPSNFDNYKLIDPDGRPTTMASVSKLNEELAIVNTRIVSASLNTSDGIPRALVNVAGTAVIRFKTDGDRKLTSIGLKGAMNMRKIFQIDYSGAGVGLLERTIGKRLQMTGK